ncbi:MAG: isochorismate synthase [Deltaproteobacteria bacterium]|nr:isochorismate synthase [Deltaproteobacteria bacterium]
MTIIAPDVIYQLKVDLDAAGEEAAKLKKSIVFGWQQPIADLDFLTIFSAAENEERFFGEYPGRCQAFVALGRAAQIEVEGCLRFDDAARAVEELFRDAVLFHYAEEAEERPLLLGGFSFNDHEAEAGSHWAGFPAGRLVLPELLLTRHESSEGVKLSLSLHAVIDGNFCSEDLFYKMSSRLEWLTEQLETPTEPEDTDIDQSSVERRDSSTSHYLQAVGKALDSIQKGDFEKVVLARYCELSRDTPFSAARVLYNLREHYPSCFIFAASMSGSSFLGATPERLFALRAGEVLSGPLAGSVRRGATGEEDMMLQKKLLSNRKELHEHAIVVRAIQRVLEPHCAHLTVPDEPSILQLPGIQHLYSEISGTLRGNEKASILRIVGDLHPTPAVGGAPGKEALEWLAENEEMERGWFAGPVGWVNDRGEGDFAIALRVALLRGNIAHLHAGAGIVAGSVPEDELKETTLKMETASSALLELTP